MAKNIIVSNRLPIRITKVENSFKFTPTSGGLATGVKSIHQDKNALWIGWPGIGVDEIEEDLLPSIDADLRAKNFLAVHLTQNELDNFYYGLPNKCLWPLFTTSLSTLFLMKGSGLHISRPIKSLQIRLSSKSNLEIPFGFTIINYCFVQK